MPGAVMLVAVSVVVRFAPSLIAVVRRLLLWVKVMVLPWASAMVLIIFTLL